MHMNDRYKKNPLTYAMPGYDIGVGHAVCMPCHAVPCNLSRIAWYTKCSGPLGRGTTELAIAIFIFDTSHIAPDVHRPSTAPDGQRTW